MSVKNMAQKGVSCLLCTVVIFFSDYYTNQTNQLKSENKIEKLSDQNDIHFVKRCLIMCPYSDCFFPVIKMVKIKRYYGKPYNVSQNLFFESYMDSVAKGEQGEREDIIVIQ